MGRLISTHIYCRRLVKIISTHIYCRRLVKMESSRNEINCSRFDYCDMKNHYDYVLFIFLKSIKCRNIPLTRTCAVSCSDRYSKRFTYLKTNDYFSVLWPCGACNKSSSIGVFFLVSSLILYQIAVSGICYYLKQLKVYRISTQLIYL